MPTFTWCAVLLLLVPLPGPAAAGESSEPVPILAKDWSAVSTAVLDADQVRGIGKRLGVQVQGVSNRVVASPEGARIQVNILSCAGEDEAEKARLAIQRLHGGVDDACLRVGRHAIEFSQAKDLRLVIRAQYALGYMPMARTYQVSFAAIPLARHDPMRTNLLYNAFLARGSPERRAQAEAQLAEERPRLAFADHLDLRALPQGASHVLTPAAVRSEPRAGGEQQRVFFDRLPEEVGYPRVQVSARIEVRAFAFQVSTRKPEPGLTAATSRWPCRDETVMKLAKEITSACRDDQQRLRAILDWTRIGAHLRFGGPVTGSRYGVEKVLAQGFGHCWDFSDVFVTLARAAGLPSRQVAGWYHGMDGHVWAEVLVPGKGWLPVDPGLGMECGVRHVPWYISEDGEMAILYADRPHVLEAGGPAGP